MRDTVDNLIADGGTAIYDATIDGFEQIRGKASAERITAVVLLTDGEDTDSLATVEDAVSTVRAQGDSDNQVRVFTIAYSAGAAGAAESLEAIAKASGGQPYEGRHRGHRGRLPQHLQLLLMADEERPYSRSDYNRALMANAPPRSRSTSCCWRRS